MMRKKMPLIYVIGIVATISVWLYVFFKPGKLNVSRVANTEVIIQDKIVNVGLRPLNKTVDTFFVLENVGEKSLIIQNVKTDCHCTVSNWDKRPIQPKQKTLIKVSYDGLNIGFFQKRILVEANILHSPLLLIFRGEIE